MEQEEEGMSVIDMINSLKEFYAELKKKWLLICVIVCISSVIGLLYSLYLKPKYIAISTVMLENTNSGSSMSGALALASKFGITSGGGGSSSVINEEKLGEIITSEIIIKTALFKKATINSTTDILANHFIDLFGYNEKWEKVDSLKGFRFTNPKENLSVKENSVLKIFYAQITKNILTIDKSKSGIITITTKTKSELFSKYFNQHLVDALTDFYVNHINEKGRMELAIVQKRVDSIAIALKDAEFALAKWKDANFQLVKAKGMMAEMQLRRNVEVNNSIYIEGVKQLEISKFNLLQDTPFLQIIDSPTLPLETVGIISPMCGILYGFVIGFILSGLYIFCQNRYTDLMIEGQREH